MNLKLVSDGTRNGTKVVSDETGESIVGIQKISLEADANGKRVMYLEVIYPEVDVSIKDKNNGIVNYYTDRSSVDVIGRSNDHLEYGDGGNIPDISRLRLEIDSSGIRMSLTQYEDSYTLNKQAFKLRSEWDKPKFKEIKTVKDI